MQIKSEIKEKIVLALDVDTIDSAKILVSELKDYVGAFKIGLQLCSAGNGSEIFDFMKAEKIKFFFDGKLLDTPKAVCGASENITRIGASFFTMHIMGGREMMAQAAQVTRKTALEMGTESPVILGVTVLTSIDDDILNNQLKVPYKTGDYALELAMLAKESGLDGVMASVWEARRIKQACGQDFKVLCPGVKPEWAVDNKSGKQAAKQATIKTAIKEGADYLVIGRTVTAAKDRIEAIKRIHEEIENVLLTQNESSAASKARLLLANGMIFEGESVGEQGTAYGELVFNTSMMGYQEILTDPGCAEQVVVMTYPEIGNYGINKDDSESGRVHVRGFIMKNCCDCDSHYKSVQNLSDYLKQNNVIAVSKIDTRALTKIITEYGEMSCAVTTEEITPEIKKQVAEFKTGKTVAYDVATYKTEKIHGSGIKLAIIDLGMTRSTIEYFKSRDCNMTIYPTSIDAETILSDKPDALLISDGPGCPEDVSIETVQRFLGKMPVFGICMGHQILAMTLGAKTYKLKYGHRGQNHPVVDTETNKVFLTAQNHGWAVVDEEDKFGGDVEVTHRNLYDNTIEGLKSEKLRVWSVQFTPEAACGEHDANLIFDKWIKKVEKEVGLCPRT